MQNNPCYASKITFETLSQLFSSKNYLSTYYKPLQKKYKRVRVNNINP